MRKPYLALTLVVGTTLASCQSTYQVTDVTRTQILVDQSFDAAIPETAEAFLAPYKQKVDSIMSPVVGYADHYMATSRPESDLSNLLADILMWGAARWGEHPDMAVYNMGGIRAGLAKGKVTYGDVLDVAPFENKLCLLTLTGAKVLELFAQIASTGGEAVSHGVQLRITADGKLAEASLHGKPIDPTAKYRIATLDYLAQGNDKLVAFKAKTDVVSPQDEHNNVRHIIMDYFREHQNVGAAKEGRIIVNP